MLSLTSKGHTPLVDSAMGKYKQANKVSIVPSWSMIMNYS